MYKLVNQQYEYIFICDKCNKELPYSLMSENSVTCTTCIEKIEERIKAYKRRWFKNNKKEEYEKQRKKNIHQLLKLLLRGVKGMAFIDLGEDLIHIDNIISIHKEEFSDFDGKEYFQIILNTREDKEHRITELSKTARDYKLEEIKKVISEKQRIYDFKK